MAIVTGDIIAASDFNVYTSNIISSTPTNLTAAQCKSYIHYISYAGDTTINLPDISLVASGAYVLIYMQTAYVLTIDPSAADRIVLNGIALDDGDKIISAGGVGNYVALHKDSASGWTVVGRSGFWSDGG